MLRIPSPKLGILDLSHGRDTALAASDRALLAPIFDDVTQSVGDVPACDVLFIYCSLNEDGTVVGADVRLPEILSKSGAMIAVVASENSATAYQDAMKDPFGKTAISANLVLTLKRRGDAFGGFFHRLFNLMRDGKSMPVAWVELAPQHPGQDQPQNPDTIFVAAAGQVGFEKRKQDNRSASASPLHSLLSRLLGK